MPTVTIDGRNGMLAGLIAAIGASARIQLRTGDAPSSGLSGTLLATFTLASTWASTPSGGSFYILNAPLSTTVVAEGTPGHFVLCNSDLSPFVYGTVGVEGADDAAADLLADSLSLFAGREFIISRLYFNTLNSVA